MIEVWKRDMWVHDPACGAGRGAMPSSCFCFEGKRTVARTVTYDDRGNVTMTRQEAEGLLKLAGYAKEETR